MLTGTRAICKKIDLIHNPFLKTISFEYLSIYYLDGVTKLLSRVTSSVIESVTLDIISIDTSLKHAELDLHASELAALFIGTNSVFLEQSMTLRFRISKEVRASQTAIRESLSELDTQRRLEFI
jgi:hypothetical protein